MVALGGEATPAALARRWLDAGVRVANTYGVTECVAYQSFREITDPSTQDVRALGDPLPGVTFAFAAEPGDDPTASAKAGELAELWIGGKQLGMGYLNRPELTVERFQRGLYRTGDIVRVGPDGQCVLLGRRDDQVKINGQRVELGEIEDAMRRTCGSVVSEVKCVITREKQLVGYYTSTAAKTSEMMAMSFMRMLSAGPEVSLRGSPTVSPTTAALWHSPPLRWRTGTITGVPSMLRTISPVTSSLLGMSM